MRKTIKSIATHTLGLAIASTAIIAITATLAGVILTAKSVGYGEDAI